MYLRLFLFAFFAAAVSGQGPNPIVRVSQGLLQGSWKTSPNGRTYASFEGIPYAKPPVGKYRFREPQNLKPWMGTWDATRPLTPCLQYNPFSKTIEGSENCLFLNVYTPNTNSGGTLPVLVYIHGGAFMYGSASHYDPGVFLDRDVVVVTLNYRLGPLGFLSTGDESSPGNFGLKDQAFALRWVQNNIMMFGGNAASVTLSGCSAGGASVHFHYLSPLSRGTFVRGIAWSGSAFAAWTLAIKPAQKAKTLASIVGCPTTTNREMVDCLKYRPAEVIVNAQIEMFDWRVHMFTPFVPTMEPHGVRDPFLTQYPYHTAQTGGMQRLPLITSVTREEGLYPGAAYMTDSTILPEIEANWNQLASNIFEYNDTLPAPLRPAVAAKIKQQYFGGKPINNETFPELVKALGDRLFDKDVGRLAEIHAQRSGQPVYMYRFSHRASFSLSDFMSGTTNDYGVSHGDDMMHLFTYGAIKPTNAGDKKMQEILLDMVYSYATTGVPRVSIPGAVWHPVKPLSPELNYLEIYSTNKAEMKASSDFGNRSFWDSLGLLENDKFQVYMKDEL